MQTLNVGAGRTDAEYQAAEAQRMVELREESHNAANFFFYAAIAAGLGTGLLPIRFNLLVNIGVIDLLTFYGRSLGTLVLLAASAAWVLVLLGLGVAARAAHRWAFFLGIAMYACDMIALITMFSIWAFGVHSFFIFMWYKGQVALRDLREATASKVAQP